MTVMTNYVCWKPEVVTATIATEAASPSSAVLLATHTPLKIRLRDQAEAEGSITEAEFLEEFLNSPAKEGVRVAPILGESGSGKSHLVRWAKAKISEIPGQRKVIYLPKTRTSLRDVIEELLKGQSGPIFDEIRGQLGSLRESVDKEKLQRRILDELAEAVREVERVNMFTKVLGGERGLYVLLHDPVFREYMLQSESFVPKRAEHALRGRGENDDDVPPAFTTDDLPTSIASISETSGPARAMYRRLTSDPNLQTAAIDLLNDHLDVAVMRAADIGVGSIQRAFMALREQLVGQEIILLIEDFALIQGIRRDLLDAIIEVGKVEGEERYATVRTMMAVTTGYYDKLDDTFRTRVAASSPVYTVDLPITDADVDGGGTLTEFVGRYLNAARLGAQRIEAGPDHVNACMECPLMDECHAAFGATKDGYGLYPYNEPAIRRAIAITADPERKGFFNPRRVLSRMVRGVLTTEASAIREGRFPSPEFLQEDRARDSSQPPNRRLPDLDLSVREAVYDRYDEPERGRYMSMFQFWGARTPIVKTDIYRAFSLPPADIQSESISEGSSQNQQPPVEAQPTGTPKIRESLRRQLADVDEWSKGSQLPQAVARDIRNIVRAALVADLDWSDPIMKNPSANVLRAAAPDGGQLARTVSIEGSPENLPQSVKSIVRFERNPKTASFFQSLLRFKDSGGQESTEALIRLRSISDEYRPEVVARVIRAADYTEEQLATAAASLIAGAALCGQVPPKPKLKEAVAAMLWSGKAFRRGDAARTARWIEAEVSYIAARESAVEQLRAALGASQGAGAVHAIDDPRVRKVAEAALNRMDALQSGDFPAWCRTAERARTILEAHIPAQVTAWKTLLGEIRLHVPLETSYSSTVDSVIAATSVGQALGFVKASLAEVETANRLAKQYDFGAVTRMEASLTAVDSLPSNELAIVVGSVNADQVLAIRNYLHWTSEWLNAGLADAEGRERAGVIDVDNDIEKALESWLGVLSADGDEGFNVE